MNKKPEITKETNTPTQLFIVFFLSQVLTIVATRLYLEVTNYPQIAFSEYHLSHVLWGGVLMYTAFVLSIFNFQKKKVIYILAGMGYGLFIDEVGKFITREYDYFHYLSIPIIIVNVSLTLLFALSLVILDKMAKRAEAKAKK